MMAGMSECASMTARSPQRLLLLDGLRGIAAISVMGYHFGHVFHVKNLFARGYLFVDFFFILSGFVLTLALEPRLAKGWPPSAFIRARIIRLWPMAALGAVAGAMVMFATRGSGTVEIALTLLMALAMIPLTGIRDLEAFPLNGPQWSLLFELIANLVHAMLLQRLATKVLLGIAVISGTTEALVIFTYGSNRVGPDSLDWYAGLPRVAFAYTLGICFGRLWQSRRPRIESHWLVPFALISLLPIALCFTNGWLSRASGDALSVLVAMPALFWLAACGSVPSRLERVFSGLGILSFPLYAVHLPILKLFGHFDQSPITGVAALATSLMLAAGLGFTIDHRHKATSASAQKLGEAGDLSHSQSSAKGKVDRQPPVEA